MRLQFGWRVGWVAFGLIANPLSGRPQTEPPALQRPAPVINGPLVQQLAFLAGRWRGGVTGGSFDEEWSQPAADSMTGMFRYAENGKVKFYEFMVIEAAASGPVLRLRHFDPGLDAWEEKNAALSYPLQSFTEKQVVFASPDKSTRLTYRRSAPDALVMVLERTAAGHTGRQEFDFRSAP
ncbi:MAG TPA: DUF6265 family protein [Terriglobia bacterium]|nr:DUF6265 family protein [Terriglobia bacterium]